MVVPFNVGTIFPQKKFRVIFSNFSARARSTSLIVVCSMATAAFGVPPTTSATMEENQAVKDLFDPRKKHLPVNTVEVCIHSLPSFVYLILMRLLNSFLFSLRFSLH
jgi:hypothetical protein